MPGFDGTGPIGMGSMTGCGRGFCTISLRSAWPEHAGSGFHIPYAETWGAPYYGAPTFTPQIIQKEKLDYLKSLSKSIKDDLKEIEARIQQIESKKEQR